MPPREETRRWTVAAAVGQGGGPGQAHPLQAVALAGWDGAGQGAPQHAVLGDDVHQLAIQADPGPLPGQRGADQDQPVEKGDAAGAGDQPVHLDTLAGGKYAG